MTRGSKEGSEGSSGLRGGQQVLVGISCLVVLGWHCRVGTLLEARAIYLSYLLLLFFFLGGGAEEHLQSRDYVPRSYYGVDLDSSYKSIG